MRERNLQIVKERIEGGANEKAVGASQSLCKPPN
jgi:hypothetical protein